MMIDHNDLRVLMSPLLQFFFVHTSLVLYVTFVLSLFVPHLSFFWCLGKVVLRDSAISWVSSHIHLIEVLLTTF